MLYNQALNERKNVKKLYKNIKLQKKGEKVVKNNCEKYFLQTKKEISEHFEALLEKNSIYQENLKNIDLYYAKLKECEFANSPSTKLENKEFFFKAEQIETWKIKFEKLQGKLV